VDFEAMDGFLGILVCLSCVKMLLKKLANIIDCNEYNGSDGEVHCTAQENSIKYLRFQPLGCVSRSSHTPTPTPRL